MTATTDPRKACLVLHGKAAARDDVREAVRAVRKDGYRVDVRVTWETGDASRSAREATETGYGVVVAGGGDGTVNEVVAGMTERTAGSSSSVLAVLPLGTANDVAHACCPLLEAAPAARTEPA
jgi:diacylglycerol kinase family enzyme